MRTEIRALALATLYATPSAAEATAFDQISFKTYEYDDKCVANINSLVTMYNTMCKSDDPDPKSTAIEYITNILEINLVSYTIENMPTSTLDVSNFCGISGIHTALKKLINESSTKNQVVPNKPAATYSKYISILSVASIDQFETLDIVLEKFIIMRKGLNENQDEIVTKNLFGSPYLRFLDLLTRHFLQKNDESTITACCLINTIEDKLRYISENSAKFINLVIESNYDKRHLKVFVDSIEEALNSIDNCIRVLYDKTLINRGSSGFNAGPCSTSKMSYGISISYLCTKYLTKFYISFIRAYAVMIFENSTYKISMMRNDEFFYTLFTLILFNINEDANIQHYEGTTNMDNIIKKKLGFLRPSHLATRFKRLFDKPASETVTSGLPNLKTEVIKIHKNESPAEKMYAEAMKKNFKSLSEQFKNNRKKKTPEN